jgi:hypothetical protein
LEKNNRLAPKNTRTKTEELTTDKPWCGAGTKHCLEIPSRQYPLGSQFSKVLFAIFHIKP